jgi:hypothetical protein
VGLTVVTIGGRATDGDIVIVGATKAKRNVIINKRMPPMIIHCKTP